MKAGSYKNLHNYIVIEVNKCKKDFFIGSLVYTYESIIGIIECRSKVRAKAIALDLNYSYPDYLVVTKTSVKESIDWDSKPVLFTEPPSKITKENPRGAGRKPKGILKQLNLRLSKEDLAFLESQPIQAQYVVNLIKSDRLLRRQNQSRKTIQ